MGCFQEREFKCIITVKHTSPQQREQAHGFALPPKGDPARPAQRRGSQQAVSNRSPCTAAHAPAQARPHSLGACSGRGLDGAPRTLLGRTWALASRGSLPAITWEVDPPRAGIQGSV